VLFANGIGRTDFPGGSMELLLTGIQERLLPLPDDFELLPGHGPTTSIGDERWENPFLQD
jgi:glyoxylase-like metal-dependent hydrolase (beta-lactamase superfamily II)